MNKGTHEATTREKVLAEKEQIVHLNGLYSLFNLSRSMSKKGCTADNAASGGVFGRLRNEMFCYRT
ncbi:hypothetical protein [Aminivibrio sp.]|uniref:hypothetical protein n=1 Tax=Aminivibrio sp. TaxID=1872489 RepID=UPI003D96CD53